LPAASPGAPVVGTGGDEHIEVREYLSLTITVDHEVIDGAPAARFAARLKELIETGSGILELPARPVPDRDTAEPIG
jgi:pyruvate/2-oxoglutarate dehydrogenase complex dihydrolipoamide acyltransferase (E2) component